jgi:hypothetical protein
MFHLQNFYVQVPNPFWQPVPQYDAVLPHHPELLQQFPNVEPWHVSPLVPPQVASVVTCLVAVAGTEVEALVEGTTTADEAREDVTTTAEEATAVPVHVPKRGLQPVPQ